MQIYQYFKTHLPQTKSTFSTLFANTFDSNKNKLKFLKKKPNFQGTFFSRTLSAWNL